MFVQVTSLINHIIHSYTSDSRGEILEKNLVNKIFCSAILVFLVVFMLLGIILPDKELSESERRKLAQLPEISLKTLFNGEYYTKLDEYLADQFPLRDGFRNFKGLITNKVFFNNINNNVLIKDDKLFQIEGTLNEDKVLYLTDLINKIVSENVKGENIYYSIIPDKNYYLSDKSVPKLNYTKIEELMKENLVKGKYISIFNSLDLDAYYATDIHWSQDKLEGVVKTLGEAMGFNVILLTNEKKFEGFKGALYSKVTSNIKTDDIIYLYNDIITNAKVYDVENGKYISVYNDNDFNNVDPYDIYLGGAKPLLVIENESCTTGKELIMFRDSFGSSLSPLLIESYSKITLVDLRYINSSLLTKFVEFNENQDILFMYSTPIINSSTILK